MASALQFQHGFANGVKRSVGKLSRPRPRGGGSPGFLGARCKSYGASLFPCEAHLTFADNTFVRLVDALYPVLKLAFTLTQFSGDGVPASWNTQTKGGSEVLCCTS